jgi:hypothetical protein
MISASLLTSFSQHFQIIVVSGFVSLENVISETPTREINGLHRPSGHVLSCACTTLLSLPNLRAGVYGRVYRALQRMENEGPTIADRL